MLRSRIVGLVTAVTAATAVPIVAIGLATPASAAFIGIKCTAVKAASHTDGLYHLSGCNGNTGGGGSFALEEGSSQIISWTNGRTTRIGGATIRLTEADKDAKGSCPSGTTEFAVSGAVKADTTGSAPVPGRYSFEACEKASPTGYLNTNEPGSIVKFG